MFYKISWFTTGYFGMLVEVAIKDIREQEI